VSVFELCKTTDEAFQEASATPPTLKFKAVLLDKVRLLLDIGRETPNVPLLIIVGPAYVWFVLDKTRLPDPSLVKPPGPDKGATAITIRAPVSITAPPPRRFTSSTSKK
jgi:hypothetical protein